MDLNLVATLSNLNLRPEMAGPDVGPLAIDLSLKGTTNMPDKLVTMFSTPASHERLLMGLWNEVAELFTGDLERLALNREISNVRVSLKPSEDDEAQEDLDLGDDELGPIDLVGKVSKIVLVPKPGKVVDFALRVQAYPAEGQLEQLSKLLRRELTCELSGPLKAPDEKAAPAEQGPRVSAESPKEGELQLEQADGPDPLYTDALAMLEHQPTVTVSYLQRALQVGYSRAARIIERMEAEGFVGPAQAGGERELIRKPVGEGDQIPVEDSRAPVAATSTKEPNIFPDPPADDGVLVPGQKPPQRPKRSTVATH